jgi:hypothetical protein
MICEFLAPADGLNTRDRLLSRLAAFELFERHIIPTRDYDRSLELSHLAAEELDVLMLRWTHLESTFTDGENFQKCLATMKEFRDDDAPTAASEPAAPLAKPASTPLTAHQLLGGVADDLQDIAENFSQILRPCPNVEPRSEYKTLAEIEIALHDLSCECFEFISTGSVEVDATLADELERDRMVREDGLEMGLMHPLPGEVSL